MKGKHRSFQQRVEEFQEAYDDVNRYVKVIKADPKCIRFGIIYAGKEWGEPGILDVFPEDLREKLFPIVEEYYKRELADAQQRVWDAVKAMAEEPMKEL